MHSFHYAIHLSLSVWVTWSFSAGVAVAMSTLMTQPEMSVPFSSQLFLAQSASMNL